MDPHEVTPADKGWKSFWLERQQDPRWKRKTRIEKREVRRRFHKKRRRAARVRLQNEPFDGSSPA